MSSSAIPDSEVELLRRSLGDIFPVDEAKILSPKLVVQLLRRHRKAGGGMPRAVWDAQSRSVVVFLYPDGSRQPYAACGVQLEAPGARDMRSDLKFVRRFAHLFNEDLARCPTVDEDDAWHALTDTRFARAIADMSPFDSRLALGWIQAMKRSMSLTYEGRPVHHCVLFAHDSASTLKRIGRYVARLDAPLAVEAALLEERWVRAVVDGDRVILLGDARGQVVGLISFSSMARDGVRGTAPLYGPHMSLTPLQHVMRKNDMALIVSPYGDLYVQLWNGVTFKQSQGRWTYQNYLRVHQALSAFLGEDVVLAVLRAALDLSFERKGALLFIRDAARVRYPEWEPIGDSDDGGKANRILRNALRGMRITKWADRQVITAAASTDGATVLDLRGRVVDIACMVKPAPAQVLSEHGFDRPQSSDGARSSAAWHASFFGIAIKVSDDGPISIWRDGMRLTHLD